MHQVFRISIFAIAILLAPMQLQNARTFNQTDKDPITLLPASDIILSANVRRILNEALPRILVHEPDRLAKLNKEIDGVKAKTGFDIRSITRLYLAMRPDAPLTDFFNAKHVAAIVQGTFNADLILAAAKLAMNGKYREEKHAGKSVFLFDITEYLNRYTEKSGTNVAASSEPLAVTVLNTTTLAVGDQQMVNQVIDNNNVNNGTGTKLNTDLVNMMRRNPMALLSMGAIISPDLLKEANLGNDEIGQLVSSIKQAFVSTEMVASGFDLNLVAGTTSVEMAKSLAATVGSLKQLAPTMIQNEDYRRIVSNINLSTEGTDLLLETVLSIDDVNKLAKALSRYAGAKSGKIGSNSD